MPSREAPICTLPMTRHLAILCLGEAQLSHWVVGQTPAMQGLEELRPPPEMICPVGATEKKAPHAERSGAVGQTGGWFHLQVHLVTSENYGM